MLSRATKVILIPFNYILSIRLNLKIPITIALPLSFLRQLKYHIILLLTTAIAKLCASLNYDIFFQPDLKLFMGIIRINACLTEDKKFFKNSKNQQSNKINVIITYSYEFDITNRS